LDEKKLNQKIEQKIAGDQNDKNSPADLEKEEVETEGNQYDIFGENIVIKLQKKELQKKEEKIQEYIRLFCN
jgi:hypothetical protein